MKTFSDHITEAKVSIYRNEKETKWSLDQEVQKYIRSKGNAICGIGLLEKFAKNNEDKVFIFTYLGKTEYQKGIEFDSENKNKSEKLVRYNSSATFSGAEKSTFCVLNADKGYMRFMENIEDDPDIEDAKWSKPQKFRVIYY